MYFFRDVYLNLNSRVVDSLQKIKGIGLTKSFYLLSLLGFSIKFRINYFNRYWFEIIVSLIKRFYFTGERLSLIITQRVLFFFNIGLILGLRLSLGLPVHGQRTRSNSNTAKRLRFRVFR